MILLLAFGSLVAMGLPIGTALLGLAVGAGSLSLVAYVVDIPSWATVIGSMVGLGVGIDYALFVLTRFREYLAEGWDVVDAVGRSLATAGRSVVFAGGTVVVAILGLAVARIPFVTAGGVGISAGRAGDGARLHHVAAGAARTGRAPGQRAAVRSRRGDRPSAGGGGASTSAATPRDTPWAPPSCCSPSRRP